MAELSDEMLMAYADGALDPADHAAVEAAIERHPEYRRKVEKFRATLKPVQSAFATAPPATRIAALIAGDDGQAETEAAALSAGRVVFLPGRQARARAGAPRRFLPTALAASIAGLAGGALGWFLHTGAPADREASVGLVAVSDRGLVARGALERVLETERSGTAVAARVEGGQTWQLGVSFTFRSLGQENCRRYEASNGVEGRFAGYACRSADQRWVVYAHAKLARRATGGAGFAPAAGGDDGAVDAAIRAVMDGDVLQSDQEAALIAGRWASKDK